MKDHVPDLERCKRLREMGYGQDTMHWWVCMFYPIGLFSNDLYSITATPKDDYRVRYLGSNMPKGYVLPDDYYPAPIVTELLAEIRKLVPDDWVTCFWDNGWWGADCDSYSETGKAKRLEWIEADTLPNALADLWMELKGENHDT